MSDLEFIPKKEEELVDLLKEGEGNFQILSAEKKQSHAGNSMIKLTVKVWDCEGKTSNIFDYLMLSAHNFSLRKIKHFCESCELHDKYESGKLNAIDCENQFGKLIIGIEIDKDGKYPPKNKVLDYCKSHKKSDNKTADADDFFGDDLKDIQF